MSNSVEAAVAAFSKGLPVCLFDSEKREGETDLLFSAQHATPATMRQLRQDCGGYYSSNWPRGRRKIWSAIFTGPAYSTRISISV